MAFSLFFRFSRLTTCSIGLTRHFPMILSDRFMRPQAWIPMSSRLRGPVKGHLLGDLALIPSEPTSGLSSPVVARVVAKAARDRAATGMSMTSSKNSSNFSPWTVREARRHAARVRPPGRPKERMLM